MDHSKTTQNFAVWLLLYLRPKYKKKMVSFVYNRLVVFRRYAPGSYVLFFNEFKIVFLIHLIVVSTTLLKSKRNNISGFHRLMQ